MGMQADGSYVADTLPGAQLPTTASGWNPMEGASFGAEGGFGAPSTYDRLSTIGRYQPYGSGLPADAGFGTKLGSWFSGNGQMIGNMANLAAGGVQAYLGLQQLGLAKKSFNFEKKAFKTNLKNSVSAYNTQMNDRISGRYYATEAERQAALKAAELDSKMGGG